MATLYTTRKHPVFDLEDPPELETTTNALMDEEMTTETTRVLPLIDPSTTTPSSLEQVSQLGLSSFAMLLLDPHFSFQIISLLSPYILD